MRNKNIQMTLFESYDKVQTMLEDEKPELLKLLDEHINFQELIPAELYWSFYRFTGRPRDYSLESFLRFLILQKITGIFDDKAFLTILRMSRELRDFCGFDTVPHASQITRFRQTFANYFQKIFERLVDITEPICKEIDAKKADYLIYDPTGLTANVAENNPKFLNSKINNAKKLAKKNPNLNAHSLAYSQMPETAKANPFVKQQYINGHFCYAHKIGVLSNGLGVVRHIEFFDENFRKKHPEVVSKKTDNPELDKEIADSVSLKPILSDYFETHPNFSHKTFLGDSSFDKYDIYSMLKKDFHFERMAIPLNLRNSKNSHDDFDEYGTPICPIDKTPFTYLGESGGKNRSKRFKWVCHKSETVKGTSKRICTCQNPCTDSSYGRCVYTYPDKELRLYPGIPRNTEHWDNLYRHRTLVERSIYLLKQPLGGDCRKSFSSRTAKADIFIAGIVHLIGVVLAKAINKLENFKSLRKIVSNCA